MQRGDDLEDDFIPDELVALSEDEEGALQDSNLIVAEDVPALLSAEEDGDHSKSPQVDKSAQRKRKRSGGDKGRKATSRKLEEDPVTASPTLLKPAAQAKYLRDMQVKTFSKLSDIELEDMQILDSSIADTSAWTGPRTLDQLGNFIAQTIPTLHTRLAQKSKSNGSPTLLVVTGAALRAADVARCLKDEKLRGEKGGEVAKLFAKHFKVREHVVFLRKTKVGSAVGTPGRIGKLLCDTDALSLNALTHVILDTTFRDAKNRSLLDIPETRDEVFKTVLGCPRVMEGIRAQKIQLALF